MGYFYFDESIHPQAHLILGTFVYSAEDIDKDVADALRQANLRPGIDEFKSGARMDRNSAQVSARALLKGVARRFCRIGIVVAPETNRHSFGDEALRCLDKILATNELDNISHDVFFDKGIFPNSAHARSSASKNCRNLNCKFYFEQNSIVVKGLQIADLIAHTCATMLLSRLGLVKKMIRVGDGWGYDPDSEMSLEFELWATFRHHFFAANPPPIDSWKSQSDFEVDVESSGLHIADSCDATLRQASLERFGKMYLGCIH